MYQSRRDDPLRGLDHAARKRVRRAVRRGEAVHDPRDAPPAAAYADCVAARENPIPFGLPLLLALLGVASVAVVLGVLGPVFLVPLAVAIVVRPLQARIVARARTSASLNRAYAVETGVQVADKPAPKPAWHDVTPKALVAVVFAVLALHVGLNVLDGGGEAEALPPPPAEPAPTPVDKPAWFANAEKRCHEAAAAIAALPSGRSRALKARRFDIRTRAADSVLEGVGLWPDEAHGAVVHLNSALRHEEKALELEQAGKPAAAEWKAASYEGGISASLLEALGVQGCARAFA